MANINIENISNLALNGNDLFEDSESFMTELSNDSDQEIIGGRCAAPSCVDTVIQCIRGTNDAIVYFV
jgi:hypothetical protein